MSGPCLSDGCALFAQCIRFARGPGTSSSASSRTGIASWRSAYDEISFEHCLNPSLLANAAICARIFSAVCSTGPAEM